METFDSACFQHPLQIHTYPGLGSQRAQLLCCANPNREGKQAPIKAKRRTKAKPLASPDARSITEVSAGDKFIGLVSDVGPADSSWLDIGVATLSGRQVNARLRLSRVGKSKGAIAGSLVSVYVHKVHRDSARIEVRPTPSEAPQHKGDPQEMRMLDSIQPGEHMKGTIVGIGSYGAVVDVNVYRIGKKGRRVLMTGLLPRKCFKRNWASEADLVVRDDVVKTLTIGDLIDVWVRDASVPSARLLLGADDVDAEALLTEKQNAIAKSKRQRRRLQPSSLKLNSKRFGKVVSAAPYGLFVDIGVRSNGFIHFSKMVDFYRGDWQESIPVGSDVNVRVLSVDGDRIELELVSVAGDDNHVKQVPLALARGPSAKDTGDAGAANDSEWKLSVSKAKEGVHDASPVGDAGQQKPSIDQDDDNDEMEEEVKDQEEDYDKFSDEYFEDKYGL